MREWTLNSVSPVLQQLANECECVSNPYCFWKNRVLPHLSIPFDLPSITNDNYIIAVSEGGFEHWDLPNVLFIRVCLEKVLKDCSILRVTLQNQQNFQTILNSLPALSRKACQTCHFYLPDTEMHNNHECSYCHRSRTHHLSISKMNGKNYVRCLQPFNTNA